MAKTRSQAILLGAERVKKSMETMPVPIVTLNHLLPLSVVSRYVANCEDLLGVQNGEDANVRRREVPHDSPQTFFNLLWPILLHLLRCLLLLMYGYITAAAIQGWIRVRCMVIRCGEVIFIPPPYVGLTARTFFIFLFRETRRSRVHQEYGRERYSACMNTSGE